MGILGNREAERGSRAFVFVHFVIRFIEHFVQSFPVMPFCSADAQTDAKTFKMVADIPLLNAPIDALDDSLRSLCCCIGEKDKKLISAVAHRGVGTPDRSFQNACNFREHEITCQVAKTGVDLFKLSASTIRKVSADLRRLAWLMNRPAI